MLMWLRCFKQTDFIIRIVFRQFGILFRFYKTIFSAEPKQSNEFKFQIAELR